MDENHNSNQTLFNNSSVTRIGLSEQLHRDYDMIVYDEFINISSDNFTYKLLKVTLERVRKLISSENTSLGEILDNELLHSLADGLKIDDHEMQYECIRTLDDIITKYPEKINAIFNTGCCRLLLDLFKSNNENISYEALKIVRTFTYSSIELRYYVIGLGLIDKLGYMIINLDNYTEQTIKSVLNWLSIIFTTRRFHYLFNEFKKIFTLLLSMILKNKESWIVLYAVSILNSISHCSDGEVKDLMTPQVVDILFKLLETECPQKVKCGLFIFLFATTRNKRDITKIIVNRGILKSVFPRLLSSYFIPIVELCAHFLGEIFFDNENSIEAVIDANLIIPLLKSLRKVSLSNRKAIFKAFLNLLNCGNYQQKLVFWKVGGIILLLQMLTTTNVKDDIYYILKIFYDLLKSVAESCQNDLSSLKDQSKQCGALGFIKELQRSEFLEVNNIANKIINDFFVELPTNN
uniref:Armadillo repeat-containing protein 8 n=1 Tax=Parastrongyloides trichosuri TaxID=131310 RepID=A0A0N4ZY21_PARTI